MTTPQIHIANCRAKEERCSLCGVEIDTGDKCLMISSKKGGEYHNVKIHYECIGSFIDEIKLTLKEDIMRNLK
jgi:hypothetical protein